ncbi:MAG: hypothetical protein ACD_79C01015G0001 [uncultured bacterium]|nr:MAG: hypothetical protein ACD_79C01015G0001 [uncultured bacterium]
MHFSRKVLNTLSISIIGISVSASMVLTKSSNIKLNKSTIFPSKRGSVESGEFRFFINASYNILPSFFAFKLFGAKLLIPE